MEITFASRLTGAKKTDFIADDGKAIKICTLYVENSVKNGDGLMTKSYRYPSGFEDYPKVQSLVGRTVEFEGRLETNDKGVQSIEVLSIRPVASASPAPSKSA